MRTLRLTFVATVLLARLGHSDDLCVVLKGDILAPDMGIAVRAVVRPTMHGTYLDRPGRCDGSLLVVLPEEIPGYRGTVRTVRDDAFEHFLAARYDYRHERPPFEATFSGILERAHSRRGFGYYGNHRLRLVLSSVGFGPERRIVVIQDPPMTGERPGVLHRIWRKLRFW